MRLMRRLTYANVMATIAVFGVVTGGSAYAITKIHTKDIANAAVTAKKIRAGSVRSEQLAEGAVDSRSLSRSAPVPIAGVSVYANQIFGSFNRLSEKQPTLIRTGPGVYELQIPGLVDLGLSYPRVLSSASLADGRSGEISVAWIDNSAGDNLHPIVSTFDSQGNPADRSFTYLVYPADHAVPGF